MSKFQTGKNAIKKIRVNIQHGLRDASNDLDFIDIYDEENLKYLKNTYIGL